MKIKKGRVKKILDRGYGFIEYGEPGDIFFHFSDVEEETVQEGDEVEFVIGTGRGNRPAAKKVKRVVAEKGPDLSKDACKEGAFRPDLQYFLPKDTRGNMDYREVDNFSLSLNKCIKFIPGKNKEPEAKIKNQEISQLDKNLISQINKRQAELVRSLTKAGYSLCSIKDLQVGWRLAAGLGSESIYETSLTLHHVYGVPYIPGSALKGAARSYYLTQICWPQFPDEQINVLDRLLECGYEYIQSLKKEDEDWYKKLEKKLTVKGKKPGDMLLKTSPDKINGFKEASLIFGNQANQGKVCFMDAFPVNSLKIEKDIMNPHFSEYYRGNEPPADYLTPQPIFFLTVKDTSFNFYLLAKAENEMLLLTASNWLKGALTTLGVGAKTTVGYGYFTKTRPKAPGFRGC